MTHTRWHLFGFAVVLCGAALTVRLGAGATLLDDSEPGQEIAPAQSNSSLFVQQVREATAAFRDVNQAAGYEPFGGCVSGPDEGAMGVHFVNQALLLDGELEVTKPEALIYEFNDGRARLVGVEYIVIAAQWDATHPVPPIPPVLGGQLFHFNESPNRFRLPPFYELHVWAWRDNPNGTFVDWNPRVSCDRQ